MEPRLINPNRNARKGLLVIVTILCLLAVSVDVVLYVCTNGVYLIGTAYGGFLGLLLWAMHDITFRYVELRPDGVLQRYLFWRTVTSWSCFQKAETRKGTLKFGKEYESKLLLIQQSKEINSVATFFSPKKVFASVVMIPDTPEIREVIRLCNASLEIDK